MTGGTGSFGKAFLKAALEHEIRQIRVFSRDELKQAEMAKEFNDPRIEYLMGDVRDYDRLRMATKGCDLVVHAAAIKRIEKAERDPEEAIKTNINGTINVAKACLENQVENAILISTDKACEPINLYGATKMVAEKYWIAANTYRGANYACRFSVVRYGNVMGSRGSVVPMFKEQAKEGVIKVTHQEMTRYFIELDSAVDLVLCAVEWGQGGEILLPELKAASIVALAAAVNSDARIQVTAPNPSEKLHEQLFNMSEAYRMTQEDGYIIIHPEKPSFPYKQPKKFMEAVPSTSETAEHYDIYELRSLVQRA